MTFGNPFGLALYDKEQKQVVDQPVQARTEITQEDVEMILADIKNMRTASTLRKWWRETAKYRESVGLTAGNDWYEMIYAAFVQRGKALAAQETIDG